MANKEIEDFIKDLQKCAQNFTEHVENIYCSEIEGSENTVNNLRLYLNKMLELEPKYMIVGEAPGYRGCRWSGIPFTSEKTIVTNDFFNKEYKVRDEKKPQSEATATIVWNYLDSLGIYPLMWNAFPFHTYKDKRNSNRSPNKDELKFGEKFLRKLICIYGISDENIIAVGKKAEASLKSFKGLSGKEVRHPANGGKDEFIKGMNEFLK